MRLYTFLHAEIIRTVDIDTKVLQFQRISSNVWIANALDPTMDERCYGRELKVLQIRSRKGTLTAAFRYFAGVYESESEVSVYLCRDESYARVYRTIRFNKEDNKVTSHFHIEYN